jgi:NADH:ubiquinone oxidoreductase subunit K
VQATAKGSEGMHNVWIALRTTPRILWAIGIAGLVYLLTKIFIFDSIPEIYCRAVEVGHVAQDLVEATIAALIFFVFSIQLPIVLNSSESARRSMAVWIAW